MAGSLHPPPSPLKSPMGLGAPEPSGLLWAAAFHGSSLAPGESKITLTDSQQAKHIPPMAGEQFVFVVLCSRDKIFFSFSFLLQEATWLCALFQTHPRSAAGSPELYENKEVLAGLPQSWRDRLIHPYHAGQEAQSRREVRRLGGGAGTFEDTFLVPRPPPATGAN